MALISGCRCGLNTVNFFSWCYTWVDVICIWKMFLFLWVVMSLLSSLYDIYARVKLLADETWEAEYDKTDFFSVGVDSFDWLFLWNDQFPCPWCKIVLKIENVINEDKWKISTHRKMIKQSVNDQKKNWLDFPR